MDDTKSKPKKKNGCLTCLGIFIALGIFGSIVNSLDGETPDSGVNPSSSVQQIPNQSKAKVPSPSPSRTSTKEPILTVDSVELYSAHDENAAGFQIKYGDKKTIRVKGVVSSVDEFGGDYIVRLKGQRGESFLATVDCYFDKDHISELANVSKGSKVSIIGDCDTGVMGPLLRYSRVE